MANRNDRIREDSARRSAAWLGPQNEQSAPNSLVISTPVASGSSHGYSNPNQSLNTSRVGGGMMSSTQSQGVSSAGGGGGGGGGPLDGPLPKEARLIIQASVAGEEADQAELYARRLLSTSRRVRIYKEELQAAREEVDDYKGCVVQQQLIVGGLAQESQSLQSQIQALQNELHIAQMQQETAMQEQRRMEAKQHEAQRRVEALQTTIDTIANESQRGKLLLRQLVPNLNIDNYAN